MKIKYNGTILDNYITITNIQGLGMPSTKDNEGEFDVFDGEYYEGTYFEGRVITLDYTMFRTVDKNIYQRLDEMKRILAPLGEKKLEFDCYPDRHLLARYSGKMDWSQFATVQNGVITFKCSCPFFIANEDKKMTLSDTTTVNNNGTYKTDRMKINFSLGANERYTISNNTTGKTLIIQNDANAKDIYVDFKYAKLTNSTQTTSYDKYYSAGTFFDLMPGENEIYVSHDTTFSFTELYL